MTAVGASDPSWRADGGRRRSRRERGDALDDLLDRHARSCRARRRRGRPAGDCAARVVSRSSRSVCSASTISWSPPSSAARRRARSLGAGGEEDLQLGVGCHDGADVASLGHPVPACDQLTLLGHERLAHAGVRGHAGGRLGDLGSADRLGHVATVEQHPLAELIPRPLASRATSPGRSSELGAAALERRRARRSGTSRRCPDR